jgi:hypothetical protein
MKNKYNKKSKGQGPHPADVVSPFEGDVSRVSSKYNLRKGATWIKNNK